MEEQAWRDALLSLSAFAPYVQVERIAPSRTRIELRAPADVTRAALAVMVPCPVSKCGGEMMHPFRMRKGTGGRQHDKGSVYFSSAHGNEKPSCAHGTDASLASDLAADFFTGHLRPPEPKAEAECPANMFTGWHIPSKRDPARCERCGGLL